jgi:2-polyprenyl-3-methyl-5-hydroxy-6-metoxy-1,4-benzoquinol methylase
MDYLLPDRLKTLWQAVDRGELTPQAFADEEARLLSEWRRTWEAALLLDGHADLETSLLREIGAYVACDDPAEIRRRCAEAVARLKGEWQARVTPGDRQSIERFYDETDTTIYELMWWHTLADDTSPLAYVNALAFARPHAGRTYLDFGSGVGSGAILFARHGFDVTLADISAPLLRFCGWRLDRRALSAARVDLKTAALPRSHFDFVTAMDVFEHLADPEDTVDQLARAMRPGGFLYARIASDVDPDRPQHIVQDFGPTFARLRALGFAEVWADEWLWGHKVFRKA